MDNKEKWAEGQLEDNSEDKAEDKAEDKTEDKTEDKAEDKAEDKTGDKADDKVYKDKWLAILGAIVLAGAITVLIFIFMRENNVGSGDNVVLGSSDDPVVARVNGVDILASDVRANLNQAEHFLMMDYIEMFPDDTEFHYDRIFADGQTFGRAVLEEAVRLHAVTIMLEEIAIGLDVYLDEEHFMNLELSIEMSKAEIEAGGRTLDEALWESGFSSLEHFERVVNTRTLIEEAIVEILDTPEIFAQFEYYLPSTEGSLGAKHILALFESFATEEEAKEYAEALLERLLAGEDFDMLMREYGQDPGMEFNPRGYRFGPGQMVPEFEQGTMELEIGEISGLVRSVHGYHIIMRIDPPFTDDEMRSAILGGILSRVDAADTEYLSGLDDIDVRPVGMQAD